MYHILEYCFFRNLAYNLFRNKYDKPPQQKMKGEGLQNITYEKSCSAQLVVAALNEEQGIGPTLRVSR